jgi:hypothetical protein
MQLRAPGFRIRSSSYQLAFSPGGDCLAVVGRDVALWSVPKRARLRSARLLSHPASVAFAPSGSVFAVKNTGGEILLCQTATAATLSRFVPDRHDEGANLMFLSESTLLDASWAGEVRVREASNLTPRIVYSAPHSMVTRVSRSRGEGLYACVVEAIHTHPEFEAGADHVLISARPEAGDFAPVGASRRFLRTAALAPSGRTLALRYGTPEHTLAIVDVATGRVAASTAVTQGGTGWALEWSGDGRYVALVESGGFSFRDAETLREVGWLPSPYPSAVDFAPDRGLVALGDWEGGAVAPWPGLLQHLSPRDVGSDVGAS